MCDDAHQKHYIIRRLKHERINKYSFFRLNDIMNTVKVTCTKFKILLTQLPTEWNHFIMMINMVKYKLRIHTKNQTFYCTIPHSMRNIIYIHINTLVHYIAEAEPLGNIQLYMMLKKYNEFYFQILYMSPKWNNLQLRVRQLNLVRILKYALATFQQHALDNSV